ncbi:polyprenyl synthetase family protein [Marinitenerispora sediminis]|uniref:Polyprenyl synthetase n=1 Tax=Marinitenerispora sediminis TaxID=1931232 RepID=A0A368T0D7_9ACTN|nr:polyprenyl synthetase family protein [Marinitenerispora sediminis]RCV49805.1 polyprenyl synthetase [Marinitenerispora sediminis]RCV52658.1 polyprenyl synthetase [Marinitenerispora sediminis]RCV55762.1 polyprenyl synthetase [Marinitenerispora sediminis]
MLRASSDPAPADTGPPADDDLVVRRVREHLADHLAARARAAGAVAPPFAATVVDWLVRFTVDGGKRTRPLFAWWGWRAAGGAAHGPAATAALRAASALELIQSCALVHDDVMDGSALRRGRPAAHAAFAAEHRAGAWSGDARRYGEALAVLVGDLALVWADDLLDEALDALDAALGEPSARVRVREPWRAMRTEMVAGQFLDLAAQARGEEAESAALRVAVLKTAAYSVERPLHFGAALAGADPARVEALRGYGRDIGTAFQLRDDLLGVYGDPARTGKPVGDDLREGKRTLLLAAGLRRARERGDAAALDTLRSAVGDRGLTAADLAAVRVVLDGLGARDAVEAHVDRLVRRGVRRLGAVRIDAAARDALARLAHRAAERDQ